MGEGGEVVVLEMNFEGKDYVMVYPCISLNPRTNHTNWEENYTYLDIVDVE